MSEIQKLTSDSVTERDIYFLDINKPSEIPIEFHLSSPNFACLIAWDSINATVEEISSVVEPLIKNGASYFCTWGPDCERVHDIIDEIDRAHSDLGSPEGSVIMTTRHKDEPIQEALYFFLLCSRPDEHYESSTNSSLAIVIGNTKWAEEIKKSLSAPRQLIKTVLETEE